ncbi:MAG TPA: YajQ family cyclic di-GMP-binding protein [Oceanospirillaceae bacterium]|nr:YajQ family cyclic di-GMP-binding protein [Oceanospirillaceae bacterium]
MPSFDVVSELDAHEVSNALDQANREVTTRYDFKGVNASFDQGEDMVTMRADVEFQLQQMLPILHEKLIKRGIDIRCLEVKDPETTNMKSSQVVLMKSGLEKELAKKVVKFLKEKKLKVQSQVQGDQVRVTGKKRDDLQQAIAALREGEFDMPLQFTNFRD